MYYLYSTITLFAISSEDIARFLAYRREICHSGALFYQAKEHLPKELYRGPDFGIAQMEQLLKEHDLYDEVVGNEKFYNGIQKEYKSKSVLEHFSEIFSSTF